MRLIPRVLRALHYNIHGQMRLALVQAREPSHISVEVPLPKPGRNPDGRLI